MKQTFVLGILAGLVLAAGTAFLTLRDSTPVVAEDSTPAAADNGPTDGTFSPEDFDPPPVPFTSNADPFVTGDSTEVELASNENTTAAEESDLNPAFNQDEEAATSFVSEPDGSFDSNEPFEIAPPGQPPVESNATQQTGIQSPVPITEQQTLPSPYYLVDDVQYFPPGPPAAFTKSKATGAVTIPELTPASDEQTRLRKDFIELAARQASLMTVEELTAAIREMRAETSELTAQRELEQAQTILSRILDLHPESAAAKVVREMLGKDTGNQTAPENDEGPDPGIEEELDSEPDADPILPPAADDGSDGFGDSSES